MATQPSNQEGGYEQPIKIPPAVYCEIYRPSAVPRNILSASQSVYTTIQRHQIVPSPNSPYNFAEELAQPAPQGSEISSDPAMQRFGLNAQCSLSYGNVGGIIPPRPRFETAPSERLRSLRREEIATPKFTENLEVPMEEQEPSGRSTTTAPLKQGLIL